MRSILKRSMVILFVLMLLPVASLAQDTASDPLYFPDLLTDTTLDLQQYEGKILLINFFTSWCPYCMDEMDDLKMVYDTYDPESVQIILVHPWDGDDETDTANVVSKYDLDDLTIVEDADMSITRALYVQGYPTSFFVYADGTLNGYANGLNYEMFSSILDDMGAVKRDAAEATQEPAMSTSTPVPAN